MQAEPDAAELEKLLAIRGTPDEMPEGHVGIAALPHAGGATYLLNSENGTLRREGLVNEACPETFWAQKPVA